MKFPSKVYVRIEVDGKTEYLTVSDDPTDGVDAGDRVDLGVYELKEIVELQWKPEVTMTPQKRKS